MPRRYFLVPNEAFANFFEDFLLAVPIEGRSAGEQLVQYDSKGPHIDYSFEGELGQPLGGRYSIVLHLN